MVDDDAYTLSSLSDLLSPRQDISLKALFSNAFEAYSFLATNEVDLLLLDIRMPGLDGFGLLDKLGSKAPAVIFITSYDQYAIKAIRYSAMDYLLKPVSSKDLDGAIERLWNKTEYIDHIIRFNNLKHNLQVESESELSLIIPTKQGEYQFKASDIIRCEADSNYTVIYLKNQKRFVASKTLGDIENMLLSEVFMRIHKSHLVNIRFVTDFKDENELILKDNSVVQVSRRRLVEVRRRLRSAGNG